MTTSHFCGFGITRAHTEITAAMQGGNNDGDQSHGSWRFHRRLGAGSFGCVNLWLNEDTGQRLAVKQCKPGRPWSDKNKERWRQECKRMLEMDHPNVVRALPVPTQLQLQDADLLPLLAMEFCSGGDLRQVLFKPENCCGLTEKQVHAITSDIGHAIEFLHQSSIVHRDLKPENIMLQKDGEGKTLYKVTDLGFAKDIDKDSICRSVVGTVQYFAPEQFMGVNYTKTVDYWSFGTLLYECITGSRPFPYTCTLIQDLARKKDTDISAQCGPSGETVYSSDLPTLTQLCGVSVQFYEKLLHLLLRWDPDHRGGQPTVNGRPYCFQMIQGFFNVKLINVLSISTNEVFTYPVTDIKTSPRWIYLDLERDTKIPQQEQELLLPTGCTVDLSQSAEQFFSEAIDDQPLIFLFRKVKAASLYKRATCPIPVHLIAAMKEHRQVSMATDKRRMMWAQIVHFCKEVAHDFQRLTDANNAAMLHLLHLSTKCFLHKTEIITALESLQSKLNFHNQSFEYDKLMYEGQHETGVFSMCMHLAWSKMKEETDTSAENLNAKQALLDQQWFAISKKIMCLQHSWYINLDKEHHLDSAAKAAISLFARRQKIQDDTAMMKCLLNCLHHRPPMTDDLYTNLEGITSCKTAIDQLCCKLKKVAQDIKMLDQRVAEMQHLRQKDIWKLIDVALQHGRNSKPTASGGRSCSCSASTTMVTLRETWLNRHTDQVYSILEDNQLYRQQLSAQHVLSLTDQAD